MRFHIPTINCFESLFISNLRLCHHFRDTRINHPFAWHGWCHGSFQFSSYVLRISEFSLSSGSKKVNSSQFSSVVELSTFFCPFLLFSILSGFTKFRPYCRPHIVWSGSRLNFYLVSLLPDHVNLSGWLWILSKNLTNFDPRRLSNNYQCVSPASHPNRWLYFNGIRNVSSFGT